MKNFLPLQEFSDFLYDLQEVGACWLEGSFARDQSDEYSDVDIWVDCLNGQEIAVFEKAKLYLDQAYGFTGKVAKNIHQNHPEIFQWYIQYKEHIFDIAIQSRSRTLYVRFAENEEVKVLFDKDSLVKWGVDRNEEVYKVNGDEYKDWMLVKSQVIKNKMHRKKFAVILTLYFNFIEDYITYVLAQESQQSGVVIKKGYSVFKDLYQLSPQIIEELETLLHLSSIDSIESKIDWITNRLLDK
jgi:predicted nucleotidyltransferase